MGAFTACTPEEIIDADAAGLSIKVFFPTKVVAGQPMTVNGTGFADVREVVFPNGVSVTNIELVGNGMIRVTAPAGISADGGKLIVRTGDDEAESAQDLTLGHTVVSGFSKQDGDEMNGGEQLTVYGTDLEFICRAELIDPDGNPLILEDEDFYRKGTSTVVITIPKKILEGAWIGKLYTFDGQEIPLPELNYKPASDGGHWEEIETVIWENEDGSAVSWSGKYRFALEGNAGGPYFLTVRSGKEEIMFDDILLGEVWICAGQSNMEMPIGGFGFQIVEGAREAAIKAATYAGKVRVIDIKTPRCTEPIDDVDASWKRASSRSCVGTSAIAWFFATGLADNLDVPVGIIVNPWGGSLSSSLFWLPMNTMTPTLANARTSLRRSSAASRPSRTAMPSAPKPTATSAPSILRRSGKWLT